MSDAIEKILEKRRQAEKPALPPAEEKQEDKFFSILVGEGTQENFLEIQSREGLHTAFSYTELIWIVYDPDNGIDMDFSGYLVSIEGRGLYPRLFNGIKQKRVAWVKEADLEMQDHKENVTYISRITIQPPKEFAEEESS